MRSRDRSLAEMIYLHAKEGERDSHHDLGPSLVSVPHLARISSSATAKKLAKTAFVTSTMSTCLRQSRLFHHADHRRSTRKCRHLTSDRSSTISGEGSTVGSAGAAHARSQQAVQDCAARRTHLFFDKLLKLAVDIPTCCPRSQTYSCAVFCTYSIRVGRLMPLRSAEHLRSYAHDPAVDDTQITASSFISPIAAHPRVDCVINHHVSQDPFAVPLLSLYSASTAASISPTRRARPAP